MVQMNLFAGQNSDTKNRHVDMGLPGGGGVNWEDGIDIYVLPL